MTEHINGYDAWKNHQPDEPEPEVYCDSCGKALFIGDYLYTVNGDRLCEDCLNDEYRRTIEDE